MAKIQTKFQNKVTAATMALKLKVLRNVPPPQVPGAGEGIFDAPDPGEGTSRGPVQAEPRRRDHVYNQTALQGW